MEKIKNVLPRVHREIINNALNHTLGKQVCITMISGEVITGKVVQHNKVTAYIEVQQSYDQEELEQAITVFGKDFVEQQLMKPTTIITLPVDEIRAVVYPGYKDDVEQLAYDKMAEYIEQIGSFYQDPDEQQATREIYDDYMSDLLD